MKKRQKENADGIVLTVRYIMTEKRLDAMVCSISVLGKGYSQMNDKIVFFQEFVYGT